MSDTTKIININELLAMNINIPNYQRPYKWDNQNIDDLLSDISNAIRDEKIYGKGFKYRIGTIILHEINDKEYDVVDGQQRILSLLLLKHYIDTKFQSSKFDNMEFSNKITQSNIYKNYMYIEDWFKLKDEATKKEFNMAFADILEVVIICVKKVSEAFQLFDSQNTRGKALDPHDLLKAYHLREMKAHKYEMEHAVKKWEAKDTKQIKELFDIYLFPIWNWSRKIKSRTFTSKEIDTYKGIPENSTYTYARRVKRAMPCFQITESFIAGNDFFEMVEHYMYLLHDIKSEICSNTKFEAIKKVVCKEKDVSTPEEMDKVRYDSIGFVYTKNLFFCALLCYYDRFHNFDETVVKKLFTWAFMLRVDMENLGFDSVNKYAIGDDNFRYTNHIDMFSKIIFARTHMEIANMQINIKRENNEAKSNKWKDLYDRIESINKVEVANEQISK